MHGNRSILYGAMLLTAIGLAASLLDKPQALANRESAAGDTASWEKANPVRPVPTPPLGIQSTFGDLENPPTPETVRLGRWLFYDPRLSADGTIACASCHVPQNAFSERKSVSIGIAGQKGGRKAPSFLNLAWTIYPHFFWDGRAASLEEQAKGPLVNPIEMGNETLDAVVERIESIEGYRKYFAEAFGAEKITIDSIARAIADYERTRMSGNSPYDRWQDGDEDVVSHEVKQGHDLFVNKAKCNQCHLGENFTDNRFHNLGVGWDSESSEFADPGRYSVSKRDEDNGAFKTPGLRDVAKHGPFMHDGSMKSLREVVEHYNKGGLENPHLSPKLDLLNLTDEQVDALVAFMNALNGEGYMDTAPEAFPE